MSRHRNVRSMNYSEEYEGYDDDYSHSVEDDHCISPSEAGFIYDRSRCPQMSAFISEDNNVAEEESDNGIKKYSISELWDVDVKLRLCMDEIQNVIGDMVSLSTIREAAINNNFDAAIALDQILNEAETRQHSLIEERGAERPQKPGNKDKGGGDGPPQPFQKFFIPRLKSADVENIERGVNDLNIFEGTSDSCFSSLKMLMDQHRKDNIVNLTQKETEGSKSRGSNPSTLAELSECFLSVQNPTDSRTQSCEEKRTGFIIPKLQSKISESPENWVIDLSSALRLDSETRCHDTELTDDQDTHNDVDTKPELTLEEKSPDWDMETSDDVIDVEIDLGKGNSSPFGKILCKKWKGRMVLLEKPQKVLSPKVIPFDFSTPSPDDITLGYLRRK